MSILGYFDGTAVRIETPLRQNQRVIVIPIEDVRSRHSSAAGSLAKYANHSLITKEKDAWKTAAVKKHG